jgi:hypothetical protein
MTDANRGDAGRRHQTSFRGPLVSGCAGVMLNGVVSELSRARVESGQWLVHMPEDQWPFDVVAKGDYNHANARRDRPHFRPALWVP